MSPMMVIPWGDDPMVEWDDENETHIAQHGIAPHEIDSMVDEGEYECRPHPKRNKDQKYERRYILQGETLGGRRIIVVVDHVSEARIRPVTAFDAP